MNTEPKQKFVSEEERLANVNRWRMDKGLTHRPVKKHQNYNKAKRSEAWHNLMGVRA